MCIILLSFRLRVGPGWVLKKLSRWSLLHSKFLKYHGIVVEGLPKIYSPKVWENLIKRHQDASFTQTWWLMLSVWMLFFLMMSRNVQAGHVEAPANPLLVSGVPRFLLTPTQSLLFFDPYSMCLNRPASRNLHEPWVLLNFLVWVFKFWVTNASKN